MALLTVKNISRKEGGQIVLHPTDFLLPAKAKMAVAGETGSGKTTLLKIIAGLTQASSGEVFLDDEKVFGPDERLIPGHPRIAYLSQHFELRNNYRVEEELESKNLLEEDGAKLIYEVCRINHLLKRKTTELSGGERQRIVLARLLTTNPSLLLLDEPFSNLDMPHKQIIKQVVEDIGEELGVSCIMVSHDPADLLPWAEIILVLKDGRLIQSGSPEEIYNKPADEYCAALFGDYNLLDAVTAPMLIPKSKVKFKGNKILIRPEHLLINASTDGLPCIVNKIFFCGSHSIAQLFTTDKTIRVRTSINEYAAGQKVTLTAIPDKMWVP
jgi:ABC-type sugar transport system ATPase subunit